MSMSTTSNTEIQQLKEFISDRFNQLDNKSELEPLQTEPYKNSISLQMTQL